MIIEVNVIGSQHFSTNFRKFIMSMEHMDALNHWVNYMIRIAIDSRRMLGNTNSSQIIVLNDGTKIELVLDIDPLLYIPMEKIGIDEVEDFIKRIQRESFRSTDINVLMSERCGTLHWDLYMSIIRVTSQNLIGCTDM